MNHEAKPYDPSSISFREYLLIFPIILLTLGLSENVM